MKIEDMFSENNESDVVGAGSLLGYRIVSPDGEKLGELKDIMIDMSFGRIAYGVLQFKGFLGIGDKYFPIPWDALILNREENNLVLDVDPKLLKKAESFEKDSWPDMADYKWGFEVYNHYGLRPYWE